MEKGRKSLQVTFRILIRKGVNWNLNLLTNFMEKEGWFENFTFVPKTGCFGVGKSYYVIKEPVIFPNTLGQT